MSIWTIFENLFGGLWGCGAARGCAAQRLRADARTKIIENGTKKVQNLPKIVSMLQNCFKLVPKLSPKWFQNCPKMVAKLCVNGPKTKSQNGTNGPKTPARSPPHAAPRAQPPQRSPRAQPPTRSPLPQHPAHSPAHAAPQRKIGKIKKLVVSRGSHCCCLPCNRSEGEVQVKLKKRVGQFNGSETDLDHHPGCEPR